MRRVVRTAREWELRDGLADEAKISPSDDHRELVRISACAVFPIDALTTAPDGRERTVGHAGVGVVQAGGALPAGARVLLGMVVSCGVCPRCKAGLAAHCERVEMMGLRGEHAGWGACATHARLPARALVPVPDGVDEQLALFAHAGAMALHVARHVDVRTKPFVTVLGDGVEAMFVAQWLLRHNASVRLVGQSAARLALAERTGVRTRELAHVGRRGDQDVVIDCTREAWGAVVGSLLLRVRGTLVVLARPVPMMDQLRAPEGGTDEERAPQPMGVPTALLEREGRIVGVALPPPNAVPEALGVLARGELDARPLLGRRVRLEELPAQRQALRSPDGPACVLCQPG